VWLSASTIESMDAWAAQLNAGAITIPRPPDEIKTWPFIGERAYHLWTLASINLKTALVEVLPHLAPLHDLARQMLKGAAVGVPMFLFSLIAAGFLFVPAPSLVETLGKISHRLLPSRGQAFVSLAGTTIRNVAQDVIGIALLQAVLAGLGFVAVGLPCSGVFALAVLVFAIIQLPGLVLIPVIIWSWTALHTIPAMMLSMHLVAVALINNVVGPLVMAHGLKTPKLVIFAGVIGGALAHGVISSDRSCSP
jgi:predicted PurR-regulated permease PerM